MLICQLSLKKKTVESCNSLRRQTQQNDSYEYLNLVIIHRFARNNKIGLTKKTPIC